MDGGLAPKAEWHRTVGAILTIMGVTFIVVGLVRVADSLTLAETIAYIVSGGIGGVSMLGSGVVFLTSAQVRGQWDTIDRVQAELRLHGLTSPPEAIATAGSNGSSPESVAGIRP